MTGIAGVVASTIVGRPPHFATALGDDDGRDTGPATVRHLITFYLTEYTTPLASTYDTNPSRAGAPVGTTGDVDVHHHGVIDTPLPPTGSLKRVSWGAILAGTAIGIAVLLLLTLLGLGIGTATLDPAPGGDGTPGIGALASGSGIWLLVSQLLALLIGGYVAGRLAGVSFKQGSMLHGVAVWAVTTIAMFWLATTAVGNIAGGAASMLGKAGSGIASAAGSIVPDDLSIDSLVPNIDMNDLPPEVRQAMRERNLTPSDVRGELEGLATSVVDQQERNRALDIVKTTASDIATSPGDASADIESMSDQLFKGPDAVISDDDVEQLKGELSSRFDIPEDQAQQVIDNWQARANEAVNTVQQNLVQAREEAAVAAQKTADAVSSAALLAFAASLIGLIAAAIGGLLGRPKRIV